MDEAIGCVEVNWQNKPLTGLLFWEKILNTKGFKQTWATVGLKDVEPEKEDTVATALVRDAGAIVAGLTDIPEWDGWEADNLVDGRTNNPRALDYTDGDKIRQRGYTLQG